jgi:hypothetical protein
MLTTMKGVCFSTLIIVASVQCRIACVMGKSPIFSTRKVANDIPNSNRGIRSDETNSIRSDGYVTVPNIFVHEKNCDSLNRFAACLAATEGLRLVRDIDLANHNTILSSREAKRIESQFSKDFTQVLDICGMTENEYKSIESMLRSNEILSKKVRLQNCKVCSISQTIFTICR